MIQPFPLLCGLLLAMATITHQARADPRPVQVSVTVRDAAGQPVEGAPMCVISSTAQAGGATDVNGVLVVQIAVGTDEPRLAVRLIRGCGEFRGSLENLRRLIRSYAVQSLYWVDVPPAAATASITIQLGEPVFVTGRLVDDNAQLLSASCSVRGILGEPRKPEGGRFRLLVERMQPCELVFVHNSGAVKLVQVPGSPADVELGDIVITPLQGNGPVRVQLKDVQNADNRIEHKGGAVSFIAADGSSVYTFPTVGSGTAAANFATGEVPKLPAGTYYVTPGFFGNSLSFKVLDAARAGADLTAAGIPKIVAVAGQEAALEVKVPEAASAISSLAVPPGSR